jgi:ribosomal protein S27AE
MISVNEFCPRCQSPQNMEVTISQREEVDSEGNSRKIVTKSYDCENCGSFVRSEDIEVVEGVRDGEAENIEQQDTEGETRTDEEPG